jgi:hypothetical protein
MGIPLFGQTTQSIYYPEGSLKNAPWLQQDSNFEPCRCRSCSRAEALNEDELCQDCFDSMENEIGD